MPKTKKRRLLVPILGLSLAALCAFGLIYSTLASVILEQQQRALYDEKVKVGAIAVEHFANNALPLLLDDDTLGLNVLLKQTRSIPALVYAYISDDHGSIKAHTDALKIGKTADAIPKPRNRRVEGETVYETYRAVGGGEVLRISRPVVLLGERIAHVQAGLSLDRINADLARERAAALRTLTGGGIALALLGVLVLASSAYLVRRASAHAVNPSSEWPLTTGENGDEVQRRTGPEGTPPATADSEEVKRNQVSVLFVGIKGFKAYAQNREPASLFDDLNEYLSVATTSVRQYGGFVERFVGDGIISVFANSDTGLDHAERALSAALSMRTMFRERGAAGNQLLPKAGFGISSGVVLSGRLGSEDGKETTFLGEIFKSAYSLTVMADAGEIVLSKDSYLQLENSVSVEPLPPREVMHRFQSWESFRVLRKKGI